MFQRQAPHGERLEFRISRARVPFIFVIELAQASRHFAASGTRCRDDDERSGGFHEIVFAETLVRSDAFDVVRIAVDGVVDVGFDAQSLESVAELVGGMLTVVVGDDDRADQEVAPHKLVAQAQHVFVVGDAEVGANLVAFDVFRAHHDDDFDATAQLGEHSQF